MTVWQMDISHTHTDRVYVAPGSVCKSKLIISCWAVIEVVEAVLGEKTAAFSPLHRGVSFPVERHFLQGIHN